MKKTFLFLMVVCLFMAAADTSFSALRFKMTSDKTALDIGETAVIEIFAYADDPLAAGNNGLNSWQLSMLVSGDGTVAVNEGSITLSAPFSFDSLNTSINTPSGSIKDLAMNSLITPVDSALAVGDYQKIAEFSIQALSVGQVEYSIGDAGLGFFGILRDYNPADMGTWGNYLEGTFDAASSINQLTVVPEPATFVLLGGMSLYLIRRRSFGKQ